MTKAFLVIISLFLQGLFVVWISNASETQLEKPAGFKINTPNIPENKINVLDFGALGNGEIDDTEAIQKAIDFCALNQGGVIHFPPGAYLSGTLFLKSKVNLNFHKGAILKGSEKLESFPETFPKTRSYTDNYTSRSLIYAENESDIAITGEGIINGQGAKYPITRDAKRYKERPYIIRFIGCENILVKDVTLMNSPMWVQHYLACDHLTIQDITVVSRNANYNNDGIDIDGCHFVRISGCDISAEDDGIVLKSTLNRLCENIMVDNCRISSLANAFKLGTETNGGFKNITFVNSEIYNTDNSGIALEIVDGGIIDGVFISNITMSDVSNPIFIKLANRARSFISEKKVTSVGAVRNITIKNIDAKNIGFYNEHHAFRSFSDSGKPHIPASISGLPGHPVENVHLENIFIGYTGGFNQKPESLLPVPENENDYPEFDMLGQLPASGFYLRNVKHIKFVNVITETSKSDTRKELYLDSNVVNVSRDGKSLNE